ncbi:MAG: hypothetical protein AAF415_03295 [Pseudomonadota bacterium]
MMISHFLYAVVWSTFAGGFVLFMGINAGLRFFPTGRKFLTEKREAGRLFASPGRKTPRAVIAVFVLSYLIAILVGLAVWVFLRVDFR